MTSRTRLLLTMLVAWHAALGLGAWFAPHPASAQYREYASTPPSRIHWKDTQGRFDWPSVCAVVTEPLAPARYLEDCSRRFPLRFGLQRADGGVGAIGVDEPGALFLLGTDELGRDVCSRVLHGGALSLATGIGAALIALLLATAAGGLSGYFGGWVDGLLSRGGEILMALPALYLLLAVRAALPIQTPPLAGFAIAIGLIGLLGWTRPARLIRGAVLSARERGFVLAARGFGAGFLYLLWRHVLPQTRGILAVQAALLVPRFVLLEVTLSFFGLGVPEPTASWGTMLSSLREYAVLASNGWMLSPAVALSVSLMLLSGLAKSLEQSGSADERMERSRGDLLP